ncbi:unnamed protein product [Phytophthora lilii]|uniref:Unnamed protein product n=1 Tax=Phytophthora lilii TaxID=2077276 RepID=A0A9W6WG02_9STRA|nr:unnamed protein product [Phytophthora lilii]
MNTELPTIANTIKKGFAYVSTRKHVVEKQILRGVSGVLKPGTMTLILGQPGSGKSSLMRVLSGRFSASKHVHVGGDFAHSCSGGGLPEHEEAQYVHGSDEENEAARMAAQSLYKHQTDVIIRQLGLENCQDTVIGDVMLRGVSGGERKRVTTGEMAFGNKNVMMLGEISTGLYSAATFGIVSTQRSLAKKFCKTIVISLLQPSPEVLSFSMM